MTLFLQRCRTVILIGALFLIPKISLGQAIADSLQLDEVEVVATRIHQPQKLQPVHIDVIDSARLSLLTNEDIGSVLAMESNLFIKDNGPGSFSNASQRGLSPEQIQVLWEGIPINHAMLGLTDLSLLPSSFFSSVQVSSGVPSSSFGGGLSGGLYLNSDFKNTEAISLAQSTGSYGQYACNLKVAATSGPWNVSVRSQYADAQNDYEYFNRADQQIHTRQHNHQQQKQLMASAGFENNGQQLETKLWLMDSENQIPGSILKSDSRSWQNDDALRWLTTYQTEAAGIKIKAKNYLDRVGLDYFDSESDVQSRSTSRRWLASAEAAYRATSSIHLKGELSVGITGVETNNYPSLKTRKRLSVLINPEISILSHKLKLYPATRFDSYSDFGNVISPSLGLNYELMYDKLYLRGQLSRDFNPPTFNALYWAQAGKPNLEPERSKSAEAGAVATFLNSWLRRINLTGFYNRVHNGIRWYPDEAGTYRPSNIEEIASKGAELSTESRFQPGWGIGIVINQTASRTQTEIVEPRFSGDAAVGHQMRYVPKWSYRANLQVSKAFLSALVNYQWVSRRYTTDTERVLSSLDPYQKVDFALQAHQDWLGLQFTGNLQLRNLLNADYEIIQWYAMPRRNFQFNLNATYNF